MAVQTDTIPRLQDLQELVKERLVLASLFVTASSGITENNPGTTDKSIVVKDNGLVDSTIEEHLRTKGVCIIVEPVLGATTRDQSGPAWILDAEILVKVMVNPVRNAKSSRGGANIDIYAAVKAVIQQLCTDTTRHPGGEFIMTARDGIGLSKFDEGIWAYDVRFTKEVLL